MKIMKLTLGVMLVFAFFLGNVGAKEEVSRGRQAVSEMKFPALSFSLPNVEKVSYKNGLKVFLLEEKSPDNRVHISAVIGVGGLYDPVNKPGLASFLGYLIGSRGVTGDSEKFFEEIERMGMDFNASIGIESGMVSISCDATYLQKGIKIFSDTLMRPRYIQKDLAFCRDQVKDAIRRVGDRPSDFTRLLFPRLVYKDYPYGYGSVGVGSRFGGGQLIGISCDSLEDIKRSDLEEFHQDFFQPGRILIGVSGNIEKSEVAKMLEVEFGDWKNVSMELCGIPDIDFAISANPELFFVPKVDSSQSTVLMGHLGAKRNSDDYYALNILEKIICGSFGSRLMEEVRVKRGLAYSTGGYFDWKYQYPGKFIFYAITKSESTVEALRRIKSELQNIKDNGVSKEEFKVKKEGMKNKFAFGLSGILSRVMTLNHFGLQDNYLETYLDKINVVTLEDVNRVANEYLHPNGMTILVVGAPLVEDDLRKEFGAVKNLGAEIEKFKSSE